MKVRGRGRGAGGLFKIKNLQGKFVHKNAIKPYRDGF
jgi:hypothetical protein